MKQFGARLLRRITAIFHTYLGEILTASSFEAVDQNASARARAFGQQTRPLKWRSRREKKLAILCRYNLPVAVIPLKNRLNSSVAVDPLELCGKLASDLLTCNSHATVDDDVGSVAMLT
ncbi:hypothetical protein SFHH103_04055 (plasmid) [Sinorhizobium fredii HH103]|uniref:Uncharacterized protein n=1 Tax=Sinorhizobium fredii (strain HH103) TaxID=1117943 RepID=G9ABW7_SINF1|nr:hypothetical protein SFHH103_04055 [Sinorhizobium fredii HH103]